MDVASKREGKQGNGDSGAVKGKRASSSDSSSNGGTTSYVVSKVDAGVAVLISDQVCQHQ